MPSRSQSQCLESIERGEICPVYLVHGDLLLAEAAGEQLAEAIGKKTDAELSILRRPESLGAVVDDLLTYSLFGGGKLLLVVDSLALADASLAGELVAEALAAPACSGEESSLQGVQRDAASRLLQAIRLGGLDPLVGDPAEVIASLSDAAVKGRGRAGKKALGERREKLSLILSAARNAGLEGRGEDPVSRLAQILDKGAPSRHALILAERSVAPDHPLLETLASMSAVVTVEKVESGRGGWTGLAKVAERLEEETGAAIDGDALEELSRRTLRKTGGRPGAGGEADAASLSRFGAEYRKLSNLARDQRIGISDVRDTVVDRGEEDVWALLDAVAQGRSREAVRRLSRHLAGTDDRVAARLSLFALLAGFCRQLVAVKGAVQLADLPPAERSYSRFKDRLAPRVTAPLPGGKANPLGTVHPFRLHKVYLSASRMSRRYLARLPWQVLETEMALKGGSGNPETELFAFVAGLASEASGKKTERPSPFERSR